MTQKPKKDTKPRARGANRMSPQARKAFEASWKDQEPAVRRLAKL
ncbi:MAG: hypothetical protein V4510_00195 [bacterium]